MLRTALRLLPLLRLIGMFDTAKANVIEQTREAKRKATIVAIAAILVLTGFIFFLIAVYLGLATVWPAYLAALTVSGLLLVAGGGVAMLLYKDSSSKPRTSAPSPSASQYDGKSPFPDSDALIQPALAWARKNPKVAAVGAVGIGVLAGILMSRSDD